MKSKNKEQGLVSIVSVILIILIITVITLSLASLTRRGLRQSLDEQLSTQAQYAAETGINDALAKIKESPSFKTSDCNESAAAFTNGVLSSADNIRYTCVLVNQTTSTISTNVTTSGVKTYYLYDTGGSINELTFNWRNTTSSADVNIDTCTGGSSCLTSSTAWGNKLGVLRARLIPADSLNKASMQDTIDIVGYPGTNGVAADQSLQVSPTTKKKLLFANCVKNLDNKNATCTAKVTLSYGTNTNTKYYLQVYSYYKDISVDVTGLTNASPNVAGTNTTNFTGAQATIDATGAAGDVVKRVRVTVPSGDTSAISNYTNMPVFSLGVADGLCKRFTTNATTTTDQGGTDCPSF